MTLRSYREMGMNSKTLVIVEHDNQELSSDTLKTISAATALNQSISAILSTILSAIRRFVDELP